MTKEQERRALLKVEITSAIANALRTAGIHDRPAGLAILAAEAIVKGERFEKAIAPAMREP